MILKEANDVKDKFLIGEDIKEETKEWEEWWIDNLRQYIMFYISLREKLLYFKSNNIDQASSSTFSSFFSSAKK